MAHRHSLKQWLLGSGVLLTMGALLIAQPDKDAKTLPGEEMTESAAQFVSSLTEQQRKSATFAYDDKERLNWHFIPRERKGVPLKDLEGASLKSAHKLIQSGLSEKGYDQALNVMSLEEVLYLLEGGEREYRRSRRDPLKYYLSIFGTPSLKGTWGWRVEGHHLSLNYSVTDGKIVASTPEFFGANPGTIESGVGRQIRVLGPEEDLARQILKLSNEAQKKKIWLDKTAPKDIRGGGVAQPDLTKPVGIAAADMSKDQKKILGQLLSEYLQNMPNLIEKQRRVAIEKAGFDNIHFAWWGGPDLNQPHYYRVQGPSFLIEYNNTQNNANHVHSIWRDLDGDFNVSLKK